MNGQAYGALRSWLLDLPCVKQGSVLIDVRGSWPVAIRGLHARQIESKDDMIWFVIEAIPAQYGPDINYAEYRRA